MREVCPSELVRHSTKGCAAVIEIWSRGAFDSLGNRMFLMGKVMVDTMVMKSMNLILILRNGSGSQTQPCPQQMLQSLLQNWDRGNTPTARHTYFLFGGVTSCRQGGNV
jgi:hypothetical protein